MAQGFSQYDLELRKKNPGRVAANTVMPSGTTVSDAQFGITPQAPLQFGSQLNKTAGQYIQQNTQPKVSGWSGTGSRQTPASPVEEWKNVGANKQKGYTDADGNWRAAKDEQGNYISETRTDELSPTDSLVASIRQAEADKMPQSYIDELETSLRTLKSPEAQAREDWEQGLSETIEAQKKLAAQEIEAQKQASAQAGMAKVQTAQAGLTPSNLQFLGEASRKIYENLNETRSGLDAKRKEIEQAKRDYAVNKSSSNLANLQRLQTEFNKSEASLLDVQSKLESEAKANAQAELETLVGSDYYANLSPSEQQAKLDEYTQLSPDMRQSIASNAAKAKMTDEQKTKFTTSSNAASYAAASIFSVTAESQYSLAQSLAQGSFYTPETINAWFSEALAIRGDANLSKEEKEAQLTALQNKINGTPTQTVQSEAAQLASQAAEIDALVANGTIDANTAQNIKIKLGLAKKEELPEGWTEVNVDGSLYAFNKATGEFKPYNQANGVYDQINYTSSAGVTTTLLGDTLQINLPEDYTAKMSRVTGKPGRQCAEFANDVGNFGFGDAYQSKLAKVNKSIPQPGDAFVENRGDYGHVGIVTKVYQDSNGQTVVDTAEYNYKGDQKRSDRIGVPLSTFSGFVGNPNTQKQITANDAYAILAERGQNSLLTNVPDDQKDQVAIALASKPYTPETQAKEFKNADAAKAYTFAGRLKDANNVVKMLEGENFENDPDEYLLQYWGGFGAPYIPFIGSTEGMVPNAWKTQGEQSFDQASRNFINAILRRESGAAIAQSEFDNAYKQYLPAPGDSKETLAQKRTNRESVMKSLYEEAGYPDSAYEDNSQEQAYVNSAINAAAAQADPLGITAPANPLGL